MGEDEEGTIRTLKAYMEVITGFIQQHRGRLVSTAGDSVLAEFASVVDAVRCAVEIQEELKIRNSDLPERSRSSPAGSRGLFRTPRPRLNG
jgi:adenylate cyclase